MNSPSSARANPPSQARGLSSSEAAVRLAREGPNVMPEPRLPGPFMLFLRQFRSPFIYVLLVAAGVSVVLGQTINGIFIFAVLLINALIGAVQEYGAQRAAEALKKMVPTRATVVRDGRPMDIDTVDLVPGDYVRLVPGNKVPADIRLDGARELRVDESMLTGESIATIKDAGVATGPGTPLGERADICFAGTTVLSGRGSGEVIATGAATEIGRIAEEVVSSEHIRPPLLQRIEGFTLRITWGVLILIALIFVITLLRGDDLVMVFFLGVALAVSAIPEGLPAAITVALAVGMQRMARRSVIIRRLLAVEALGSCTYIASDKTGTLTVNEMTVGRLLLPDGRDYKVSGEGMDRHGTVTPACSPSDSEQMLLLCCAGVLANEARLEPVADGWTGHGDPVDIAFLVLAAKVGVDIPDMREHCPELEVIPYESHNAYSASINRHGDGIELFVKGSVERLLEMVGQASVDAPTVLRQEHALAAQGYRVLGLASRRLQEVPADPREALHGLEFLGMVGMLDPLRPEAIEAVRDCERARIKVAMITGDHPQTAIALARQLGIADAAMQSVTGPQLTLAARAGGTAFHDLVNSSRVFARVEPQQKKEIVEQLIRDGEFVAVTGDGVNDAPALHRAHVGIAMGRRGTDVARESADLILTDDHFASIVEGIKQGRIVYSNIRKVIFLLISTGAAEIVLVMLSILLGTPLPLFPLQLLWLNLVTNGVQHIALVLEPEEGHELKRPPRPPGEPIFNRLMVERVLVNAVVMGLLAFGVFTWQLGAGASAESARNVTLLLMVLFENVHVLNSRSETRSMFRHSLLRNPLLIVAIVGAQAIHIGAMYTPGLRDILQVEPVTAKLWLQLTGVALTLILVDELHKWWWQRRRGPVGR